MVPGGELEKVVVAKEVSRDLARRSDALLIVIDERCDVVMFSSLAHDDERATALSGNRRLTPNLLETARRLVERCNGSGTGARMLLATSSAPWLVRIRPFETPAGVAATKRYALTVELVRRREQLADAMRRFSLTRRESEVLFEILGGASAAEIAAKLHLAEVTVQGYYKRLLQRTNARNRSAMVALVLGWETPAVVDSRPL